MATDTSIRSFEGLSLMSPIQAFAKLSQRQQQGAAMMIMSGMDLGSQFAQVGILNQLGRHQSATILQNMGIAQFNQEQQTFDLQRKSAILKGDIRAIFASRNVSPSIGSAMNSTAGAARNAARIQVGLDFQAQVQKKMIDYQASMARYQAKLQRHQAMMKMVGSVVQAGIGAGMASTGTSTGTTTVATGTPYSTTAGLQQFIPAPKGTFGPPAVLPWGGR